MFKPFSLFVALRYTLTRKHNFFISFVALISMLGVSLGVLILIVALSVMNGSISVLRAEALKSVAHVIVAGAAVSADWESQRTLALAAPEVVAAAPYLEGEASLRYQGQSIFIRLRGVDPLLEATVVSNLSSLYQDLLAALAETENGIILGTQLAANLGLYRGEVSATAISSLLARSLSDAQGFQVIGFADFGVYGNNNIALINLQQAQSFFQGDAGAVLQLRLKVADVFEAERIATEAFSQGAGVTIRSWNQIQASLFNALSMEKMITGFMLMMIVVVGAVNIVSTLVMVVSDKAADIAILRTMGASRSTIMKIFMIQGVIAGIIGTLVGAALGVLLANYITDISLLLERMINSVFTDANVYFISHLQTRISWNEVLLVCAAAVLISFFATLYPAYRASKVQPAEVLRYE